MCSPFARLLLDSRMATPRLASVRAMQCESKKCILEFKLIDKLKTFLLNSCTCSFNQSNFVKVIELYINFV